MRSLILAVIVACLCGCSASAYYPQPWAYVRDIGNAKAITRWALRQHESDKIGDAMTTLAELACPERERFGESAQEADAAVAGFAECYNKLAAGWPGFTPRPPGTTTRPAVLQAYLEATLRVSYHTLANYVPCERNMRLFRSIEPDPVRLPERHAAWQKCMDAYDMLRAQGQIR